MRFRLLADDAEWLGRAGCGRSNGNDYAVSISARADFQLKAEFRFSFCNEDVVAFLMRVEDFPASNALHVGDGHITSFNFLCIPDELCFPYGDCFTYGVVLVC